MRTKIGDSTFIPLMARSACVEAGNWRSPGAADSSEELVPRKLKHPVRQTMSGATKAKRNATLMTLNSRTCSGEDGFFALKIRFNPGVIFRSCILRLLPPDSRAVMPQFPSFLGLKCDNARQKKPV